MKGKILTFPKPTGNQHSYFSGQMIKYWMDETSLSATNFIREYQGEYDLPIDEKIALTLGEALYIGEFLLEKDILKIENPYITWLPQNYVPDNYLTLETKLLKPNFFNAIIQKYPKKKYTTQDILDIAFFNYVQQFTDFICEKQTTVQFTNKQDVFKRSLKQNRPQILQLIKTMHEKPSHQLCFLPDSQNPDNWKIQFQYS